MSDQGASDAFENAFNARLKALDAPKRLALGVSGGRDSIALLRLCAASAKKTGASLFAFTVDHGLRVEAAREAAGVRAWCEAIGVAHQTLYWEGDKPAAGLQAAARNARYRLLIEAAEKHQCNALLTAHTADDQAETLFMRLARGSGVSGLSAMDDESLAAAGPRAPIRILRPLLKESRAWVTAYLDQVGQDYFDDPSNDDPAFERVRVRALLAALSEQSLLTQEALAATAGRMRDADARLRAQEDGLFDTLGGCFHPWGGVSLTRWGPAPGAAGLARRLIYAAGGGEYAPAEDEARLALEDVLKNGAATLSGALIKQWKGRVWFLREPAALTGRAGVAPATPCPLKGPLLWDRRFILEPEAEGLAVGPMGAAAERFLGPRTALFQGPQEALGALPGLFAASELIGAPALPFMGERRASARPLTQERYRGGIVRFSQVGENLSL